MATDRQIRRALNRALQNPIVVGPNDRLIIGLTGSETDGPELADQLMEALGPDTARRFLLVFNVGTPPRFAVLRGEDFASTVGEQDPEGDTTDG